MVMVYYTLETVQLSQIVCDYSVITDVSCRRHARKVMTIQLVYASECMDLLNTPLAN